MSVDEDRSRPNRIEVYTSEEDLSFVKDCLTQILNFASPFPTDSRNIQSLEDELLLEAGSEPRESDWTLRLLTRYYETFLKPRVILIEELDMNSLIKDDVQAVLIILASSQQRIDSRLETLIEHLSNRGAGLNQLILHSDIYSEETEEEESWYQRICSENSFEIYGSDNLSESSMSLQCHPWRYIKRVKPDLRAKKLNSSTSNHETTLSDLSDQNTTFSKEDDILLKPKSNKNDDCCSSRDHNIKILQPNNESKELDTCERKYTDLKRDESCGFDDDFMPFVSARGGKSSDWGREENDDFFKDIRVDDLNRSKTSCLNNLSEDYKRLEASVKEVDNTVCRNQSKSHDHGDGSFGLEEMRGVEDEIDDFAKLVSELNELKDYASGLEDDECRRKFAESVSLAFEKRLCEYEE
ncbi:expressed protein [Phakopsora pachyrhizi]|uniref:Expressed protein n=1 Tax=Phakopsora pachyrhizi TaxID=170000 RepID=A0AAV0AG61_PHAPC|nr:expressed protein [Phakopsora pachyrhizi]